MVVATLHHVDHRRVHSILSTNPRTVGGEQKLLNPRANSDRKHSKHSIHRGAPRTILQSSILSLRPTFTYSTVVPIRRRRHHGPY